MPAPRALARRTPPGNHPSGDVRVRVRVRVRWRLLTSPRVRPLGAAARVQARGPEGQRRVQASAGAHHRGRLGGACARTGLARVVRSPGISGHHRPPDPSSAPRRARADPGLSTPRGPRAAPVPARLPPY